MADELSRIERLYGSVAEYNRVQEEESDCWEPDEEELLRARIDSVSYHEQIRILNGKPGPLAETLKKEWDSRKPAESDSWTMTDVYMWQDYRRDKVFAVTDALCRHYGIEQDGEVSFYRTPKDTFAIDIEYQDRCNIKFWSVAGLDYDKFKALFRDLHFLGLDPTMNCCDGNGTNHILSNSSLGSLRLSDLKWCGVETEEGLKKELSDAGFDEAAFKESCRKRLAGE